jgi:GxxExxY protein
MEKIILESSKKVYDQLGYGLMETTYEKALKLELTSRGVRCENEVYTNLYYEDSNNDEHFLTALRMDILIKEPEIILELKTVKSVLKKDDKEYYQVLRYKKIMNIDKCYLINFGIKGLEVYNCEGDFVNLIE